MQFCAMQTLLNMILCTNRETDQTFTAYDKNEVHLKDYFNWLIHIEKTQWAGSSSSKNVYVVKVSQDVFQHDLPRDLHQLHSVVRGIVLDWPNVLDESSYSI